ncbi:MAG: hypothetical protein GX764_01155 [Firmicutes bacterium]|nr:hypothetical protein [Bacillota bacterium]
MYWLKFALSALFIVLAGIRLTRSVETIARWTRLGTAWAGAFILPLATTLPELVNSWRSIYIDAPDLAAGNLLGSCLFNLSIIAFIDFVQGRGALMPKLHTGHILNAVVVIMLASVVILGIALPEGPVIAGLGWPSLLLLIIYFYGSLLLLRYEKKVSFTSPDIKTDAQGSSGRAEFTRALVEFSIAALVIFVAGMNLTDSADLLAVQTGLGQTFVGSLFIAINRHYHLPTGSGDDLHSSTSGGAGYGHSKYFWCEFY